MKATILVLILIVIVNKSKAQSMTDVDFVFKTFLFSNSINISNSPIKKRDLFFFDYFINNTKIKLDTLGAKGFTNRFVFVSLNPSNIQLAKNTAIGNYCQSYKLVVDCVSGKGFRLGGFDLNDMIDFYSYLRSLHFLYTDTFKDFCKHYWVNSIDFKCLYKAAKNEQYDPKKNPCSKRCNDLVNIN